MLDGLDTYQGGYMAILIPWTDYKGDRMYYFRVPDVCRKAGTVGPYLDLLGPCYSETAALELRQSFIDEAQAILNNERGQHEQA